MNDVRDKAGSFVEVEKQPHRRGRDVGARLEGARRTAVAVFYIPELSRALHSGAVY